MLVFTPDSARRVAELLLEMPVGSLPGLDELAFSALAEVGNVSGSYFLNALAGRTGQRVTPTTPAVIE